MAASDELRYSSVTTTSPTNATSSISSTTDNQLKSTTNKLSEDLTNSLLYLTNTSVATNENNLLNGNYFMQSLVNHHSDHHQSHLFNRAYHIGQEQSNNQNDLSVPSSPNSSIDSPTSSSTSGHLSNVNSQQLSNYNFFLSYLIIFN